MLTLLVFLVILYAVSAVYFAGVMVRLMLTLTPVVCVLAAIAFSKTFEVYLKDDQKKPQPTPEVQPVNEKLYDKVGNVLLKGATWYKLYETYANLLNKANLILQFSYIK